MLFIRFITFKKKFEEEGKESGKVSEVTVGLVRELRYCISLKEYTHPIS
jgi:hypothetical protein